MAEEELTEESSPYKILFKPSRVGGEEKKKTNELKREDKFDIEMIDTSTSKKQKKSDSKTMMRDEDLFFFQKVLKIKEKEKSSFNFNLKTNSDINEEVKESSILELKVPTSSTTPVFNPFKQKHKDLPEIQKTIDTLFKPDPTHK